MNEAMKRLKQIILLKRLKSLAEKHCPELLDEQCTSADDIPAWLDKVMARLPEADRASLEDTSWVDAAIKSFPKEIQEKLQDD